MAFVTAEMDRPNYRVAIAQCLPAFQVAYLVLFWPLVYARGMVTADLATGPMPETGSFLLNRLFFPAVAGLSVLLLLAERRYQTRFSVSGAFLLACLLAALCLSFLWSLEPSVSLAKLMLLAMQTLGLLPAILLSRSADDVFRPIFWIMAVTLAVNLMAALALPPTPIGHAGIYSHKNTLGEIAAIGGIFAFYGMTGHQRWMRPAGVLMFVVAIFLLYVSQSKTALLLFLACPFLAFGVLCCRLVLRIAFPVLILLAVVPVVFVLAGGLDGFSINDISAAITGDGSFTGRTDVWSFAIKAIEARPWTGYGYQTFWGTQDSSVLAMMPDGFVRRTPHAHNGYLDLMLQGGLFLFSAFLLVLMMVIGWIDRQILKNTGLGFFLALLFIYLIILNLLETTWLQGLSAVSLLTTLSILLAATKGTAR